VTAPAHSLDLTAGAGPVADEAFADAAPTAAPTGLSELDLMRQELADEVAVEPFLIDVPGRPGYALLVDPNIAPASYAAWVKRSEDKGWPSGTDEVKLAAIVVANATVELRRQGVSTGMTFRDRTLVTFLKAPDARNAVLTLLGGPKRGGVAVLRVSDRILVAAGLIEASAGAELGDEVTPGPRPTPRPSSA
jgi:hypothetical protein